MGKPISPVSSSQRAHHSVSVETLLVILRYARTRFAAGVHLAAFGLRALSHAVTALIVVSPLRRRAAVEDEGALNVSFSAMSRAAAEEKPR